MEKGDCYLLLLCCWRGRIEQEKWRRGIELLLLEMAGSPPARSPARRRRLLDVDRGGPEEAAVSGLGRGEEAAVSGEEEDVNWEANVGHGRGRIFGFGLGRITTVSKTYQNMYPN
jgi:hypothetical protein